MIEAAGLSVHQDNAFLVKADMAEHQIMQAAMRRVAREFASADMIAASFLLSATQSAEKQTMSATLDQTAAVEAALKTDQLHCPLVFRRALQLFGLRRSAFSSEPRLDGHYDEGQQREAPEDSAEFGEDIALDSEDIAVFRAVDALLPKLQDEGLCTGVQMSLYRTPIELCSLWRDRLMVILIPVGGALGIRSSVFVYLLRSGFDPMAIKGRLVLRSGDSIHPLPLQEVAADDSGWLVCRSSLQFERCRIQGRSFLLGLIADAPPSRHWLVLDQCDPD